MTSGGERMGERGEKEEVWTLGWYSKVDTVGTLDLGLFDFRLNIALPYVELPV